MSNALQLFRAGFDYLQIASHLNTTEAEVERQIHQIRKQEWRKAYDLAYREENREVIVANRKRHNEKLRAGLREIREARS